MHRNDTTDILRDLRDDWRRIARAAPSRRALESLRADAGGLIPERVVDLGGLVLALEPHGGLERIERAQLVAVLLLHAQDPLVRRCLLQTLLPGIVSVARKLRFGEGIADDPKTFLSDALAEATDLLCDWAGQRRPYAAPDLLGALRCRLRRRMLADKARRRELTAPPDLPHDDGDFGAESFAHRLATAAASDDHGVRLLYARCVLGYSTAQLAAGMGVSGGAVRRRMVTAARSFV
jgi:hypothetical protein